jgi:hypothetical protein
VVIKHWLHVTWRKVNLPDILEKFIYLIISHCHLCTYGCWTYINDQEGYNKEDAKTRSWQYTHQIVSLIPLCTNRTGLVYKTLSLIKFITTETSRSVLLRWCTILLTCTVSQAFSFESRPL